MSVTEAEPAARADGEHYRLLLDSSGDMIVALDRRFIPCYVSPSSRAIIGYEPQELVGNTAGLLPHPEDADRVITAFRDLLEGGRDHDRIAYRLCHRDGQWIWLQAVCRRIKGGGTGPPMGICSALRDITEQVAMETSLRESEERCRLLLHSPLTEALYLLDPEGRIETWNSSAERIKGYTAAEIIGRHFSTFFTPEDIAIGEPARVLASASDREFTAEAWRLRKDGSRFLARVAMQAIRRDDGTLRGFVKVTLDVTKQRAEEAERDRLARDLAATRDEAEKANQAKSRFLAAITHELRTPLHGILGYAELLNMEGDLNPTQTKRLEVMIDSGQHLLDTINAVLDLAQIEADRLELQPAGIELSDLIRICLNVVRPAAEAKGLTLGQAPTGSFHVVADATRLRQVLINLLGNAVKFTPAGTVEVRQRKTGNGAFVRLEVTDTGPGIWLRHRDKLFQVFERLNAKTVSTVEGAGLGLALAARLIHLMDGRIGYADNPGGGSVFWFELPVHHAVSTAKTDAAAASHPLARRLRVLVADDEALNRSIASGFLSRAGHEVVCVHDGAAAVDAAKTGDFDVILMDVRMPGMNGMEATRQIRELPGPRGQVRVVAVTAQAFAQQVTMCRQAGMNGHVSKPFKQAVLLAALEDTATVPDGCTPVAASPGDAAVEAEPDPAEFDRAVFEDATDLLNGTEVARHLRTLIERCEALSGRLRVPVTLTQARELVEDAHKLVGGAGMFGFLSLAGAARHFELAADIASAETALFADRLAAAIRASMPLLRREFGAATNDAK